MLTFEKVLDVFKEYLGKDTVCEVILTSRGYTVMYWDEKLNNWYGVEHCKTPVIMRDAFLESYSNYLEQGYTNNCRNLKEKERYIIKVDCHKLYSEFEK